MLVKKKKIGFDELGRAFGWLVVSGEFVLLYPENDSGAQFGPNKYKRKE